MKDSYETVDATFINIHYDVNTDEYIAKLFEYIEAKYINLKKIKFQNISGNLDFLNELHDVGGIDYYVISSLLNTVEITNSYYYSNLLKLTSLSTNITNNYYTDFFNLSSNDNKN